MWCSHAGYKQYVEEIWSELVQISSLLKLAEILNEDHIACLEPECFQACGSEHYGAGGKVGDTRKLVARRLYLNIECDYLTTKIKLDTWEL